MADDNESESDSEEETAKEQSTKQQATQNSKDILTKFVDEIGTNLHAIWSRNTDRLKDALVGKHRISGKGEFGSTAAAVKEQILFQTAVKDLTFILSELAKYLSNDISIATSK